MKLKNPFYRFLIGLAAILIVVCSGLLWIMQAMPTWGSNQAETNLRLPGDDLVPIPEFFWNHAITIHATPEQIYSWLVQIGDTRGGFYSFTFIENLFQVMGNQAVRYKNASSIHPEWQNPPLNLGIISDWMAIQDYQPSRYLLASATPKFFGMQWTWLWYLQPAGQNHTRLIVRHRIAFPKDMPKGLMVAILDAGYVMERGMMLGIRSRAEGIIPPVIAEPLVITLWLVAFVCGSMAGIRFFRQPGHYSSLGVALEAVAFLFIFTFIQPGIWLCVVLDLVLLGSVVIVYSPGKLTSLVMSTKLTGRSI